MLGEKIRYLGLDRLCPQRTRPLPGNFRHPIDIANSFGRSNGASPEPMRMWPISTHVNKLANDDPAFLEPVELAAMGGQGITSEVSCVRRRERRDCFLSG